MAGFCKGAERLIAQPLHVPKLDDSAPASRRQTPTVAAVCDPDPLPFVCSDGVPLLAVVPVPDCYFAVTSHCKVSAVRTERCCMCGQVRVDVFARAGEYLLFSSQVPHLRQLIAADGGQVHAIGVECDASCKTVMCVCQSLDHPASCDVPDLDRAVRASGREELAIAAECKAVNLTRVVEYDRLHSTEPHEVIPLPLSQVFGALVEKLEGTFQVVCRQFPVSQGNSVEIRLHPFVLQRLS